MKNQEAKFYEKLYKDKIILIKIGGTEIASPDFFKALKQIKKLAEKKIKFIIVFGGGTQIDEEWQKHSKTPRPKKDGISINTLELINKAVIPAYEKIIAKFSKEFSQEKFFILKPEQIECGYKNKEEFGEVGKIKKINLPKNLKSINLIGFLGELKNKQKVNINADEIVEAILKTNQNIVEIIFLTSTGCILDKNNQRVSELGAKNLGKIIKGQDENIEVSGGMLQKLKEIQKLLKLIPKIAITNLVGLLKEIETDEGSGTLITKK